MKFIPTILLMCIAVLPSSAQNSIQEYKALFYSYYVKNDFQQWAQTLTKMETYVARNPNRSHLYELSLAQYGLLGFYRESKQTDKGVALLRKAERTVDKMLALDDKWAFANCLKGAMLGLETEFYPAKVVYLGPRALSYYGDGRELASNQPEAYVELANLAYHAPEVFGGDKEEAVAYFQKAIKLYDQNPALRQNNWQYLHSLAWLARAHIALGNKTAAGETIDKLRRYSPNFHFLNSVLVPEYSRLK
ncbi:MAG: tetratricopeptide repeat protein [Bacteroidota bacterium]